MGFGYQLLAYYQPEKAKEQLVPEIPPFRAPYSLFNARQTVDNRLD
jgi:hypothetical protein